MNGGAVHLSPPPNAAYEKVDCVLAGMKNLAIKQGKWSDVRFVGNEAPNPEAAK
jgi:hypothetical protein